MENSKQSPINSGFNAFSESADVVKGIDLSGKTAVVTGGYSGLGRVVAKTLSEAGVKVIVPARGVDRATKALAGTTNVDVWPMDLQDPGSIDLFADNFLKLELGLDILINCAGVMATPLIRDSRGFESQISTNHFGHFQLAIRLWPALKRASGSRIVSVSSWGHRFSDIDYNDWNFEKKAYEPWTAYGQSKTANILFAVAADARGVEDDIRAFAVHPGTILDTNLSKYLTTDTLIGWGVLDKDGNAVHDASRNLKTESQGASTILWCATSPLLQGLGGVYSENCDIAGIGEAKQNWGVDDSMYMNGVMAYAVDVSNAEQLWKLSESLTGARFNN
ncbi:MAG TPA: SDR family NAD(P)-dependent oxidoreductase [Mucilaginibacter sp.]|jgi:NAD(P)-dependent dehydrogenase (short-subunit alcohol dehydrogenase family)